jgi:hypothetical protein
MERDGLRDIIERHTVRYEAWPHWEFFEGKRVMVGMDLELYGTHEHGRTKMNPGCEICRDTYEDLKRIAEQILPTERRPSSYTIEPFDHALHSDPRGPAEVVVVIRICHRDKYFEPVDECEDRCLTEMEQRLRALGIPGRRRR